LVGSAGKTVSVNNIATAGAAITYKFSGGLIITSDLMPYPPGCFGISCELRADSQHPDPTVASQIDPILFTGTGAPPCTPTEGTTTCPDPAVTGGSDGNPYDEPGNPMPPPPPITGPN